METRQQKRKSGRDEFKRQEALRKQYNSPATRGEMYTVMETVNKIRDRLYQLDIFCSSIEKVLIEKNIVTREEIEVAFKYEAERSKKFNEIQLGTLNYESRLDECKQWNIDINNTVIPQQILDDKQMNSVDKVNLAKKYDIKQVLKELSDGFVEASVDNKPIFGEVSPEKQEETNV